MAIDGAVNLGLPTNTGTEATPFTLSASSLGAPAITGSVTLDALTLSGSLEGPLRLPELTLSGEAKVGRVGFATLFAPAPTLSATAISGKTATASLSLPVFTLAASDGTKGGVTAEAGWVTLSATGLAGTASKGRAKRTTTGVVIYETQPTLSSFTLSAALVSQGLNSGDALVNAPSLSASALTGSASQSQVELLAPDITASALTGEAPAGFITLDGAALSATAVTGELGQASGSLPAFTLNSDWQPEQPQPRTGAGASQLDAFTLEAVSLPGGLSTAAIVLREPLLDALAGSSTAAMGSIALAEFTLASQGLSSNAGEAFLRIPEGYLSGAAVSGGAATASLELPLVQLQGADGVLEAVGTASFELPMVLLSAQAIQVLAAPTLTGLVLNTRTRALSQYAGLSPNSIARFGGVTLMATADGIVALAGNDDQGQPIAAHFTTGTSDLGLPEMKRVPMAYVGYRASGDMEMTLISDDHHEHVYALLPRHVQDRQHASRVKFGKGVSAMYWQFKAANVDGADFAFDRIEPHTASTGMKT